MPLHHGKTLEKIIRRNGLPLAKVARLTKVNRRSVYNWFIKAELKPDIIYRLGEVINHDFSIEFPEFFSSEDFDAQSKQSPAFKIDYASSSDDSSIWKDKYIDLLERYNALLSEKVTLDMKAS
jgi:hypothetical protein